MVLQLQWSSAVLTLGKQWSFMGRIEKCLDSFVGRCLQRHAHVIYGIVFGWTL